MINTLNDMNLIPRRKREQLLVILVCALIIFVCAGINSTVFAEYSNDFESNQENYSYMNKPDKEEILNFNSYITINKDSSMIVQETIEVISNGDKIKRGIYRDFPTVYKDQYGNRYRVGFEVLNVERDNSPEQYRIENVSNGKRIYLGKDDVFLPSGVYTYIIKYRVTREIGFFENHDELFWNVTGNGWDFAINNASATVVLPEEISKEDITIDGFTGPKGSKDKNFTSSLNSYPDIQFFSTEKLDASEGLTILVQWPKGFVTEPTIQQKFYFFMQDNIGVIVVLAGFILLIIYYLSVWIKVGKDPSKGTIIPLYSPPEGFSPADIRYIKRMGYDQKTFAAAIINMAVKGYVKIIEKDGDYIISKDGADESVLLPEEQEIADKLLGKREEIKLDSVNYRIISKAIESLKNNVKTNFENKYFKTNKKYYIMGIIISVVFLVAGAIIQAIEKQPSFSALYAIIFLTIWLSGWTTAVLGILSQVFKLWKNAKAITTKGSVTNNSSAIFLTVFSIPFIIGEFVGIAFFSSLTSISIALILIGIILVNLLFFQLLKAPTIEGRKVLDEIEGFKLYLSVAEKDQLNFAYPIDMTPDVFEKYLPYALALDVEQQWAEKFSNVFACINEGEREYSPNWYSSGTAWSSVGAVGLVSSLGSSLTSSISSSSSAPGSSSGGGGGGSSGGGGGGGGGGGW